MIKFKAAFKKFAKKCQIGFSKFLYHLVLYLSLPI